jgi:hypothetical protein
MNDPIDTRIKSFVVELLDDPPPTPPLPKQADSATQPPRRSRGPAIAAAAFAAIVIVGGVFGVLNRSSDGDPDVATTVAVPTTTVSTTAVTTTAVPPTAVPVQVSVVVPGAQQWTDTGIDISIGDGLLIEAAGAVDPSDSVFPPAHGPDGNTSASARFFNLEGLEQANHAGLIGRIGETGAPFHVGSEFLSTADTEGRLFLGINDVDVENNDGEFTATVTVNP